MNKIVKILKNTVGLAAILLIVGTAYVRPAHAQSDYQQLAWKKNQPKIHITVFTLPGANDNQSKLTAAFQLSNNFLPFKKMNPPRGDRKFFSTAALNLEVFRAPQKIKKSSKEGRWRSEQIDVEGLESVGRDAWQDTAYADTYEQTKSSEMGLNGAMQVDVSPGYYTYLLQFDQDKQPTVPQPQRGRSGDRIRNSRTRNLYVPSYENQHHNNIILIQKVDDIGDPSQLDLINMGDNVTYGKDFYAFIHLPEFKADANYSFQINRIETEEKDTTQIGTVLKNKISSNQIIRNVHPRLQSNAKKISLRLAKQNKGYNYALVKIPNAKFPNAVYRLVVTSDDTKQPVAQGIFRSYWSNIPTSLLNLNVAIEMMHYITDNETIKKINEGSDREREEKFRKFWKAKDPTPDTEFNELEAEYYRRIDYAYENFGSQNKPGYDTDRGRIYINYGPPQDKKRIFPTDGPTTIIWTYKSRSFVFKATSGFGDFKLVSQK